MRYGPANVYPPLLLTFPTSYPIEIADAMHAAWEKGSHFESETVSKIKIKGNAKKIINVLLCFFLKFNFDAVLITISIHITTGAWGCSKVGVQITYYTLKSGCTKYVIHLIETQRVGAQMRTLAQ